MNHSTTEQSLISREWFDSIFKSFALNYGKEVSENTCWVYWNQLNRFKKDEIIAGLDETLKNYKDYFPTSPQVLDSVREMWRTMNPVKPKEYTKSFNDIKTKTKCGADFMKMLMSYEHGELNNQEYYDETKRLCKLHGQQFPVGMNYYLENPEFRNKHHIDTKVLGPTWNGKPLKTNVEKAEQRKAILLDNQKEASKLLAEKIIESNGENMEETILPFIVDRIKTVSEIKLERIEAEG